VGTTFEDVHWQFTRREIYVIYPACQEDYGSAPPVPLHHIKVWVGAVFFNRQCCRDGGLSQNR